MIEVGDFVRWADISGTVVETYEGFDGRQRVVFEIGYEATLTVPADHVHLAG